MHCKLASDDVLALQPAEWMMCGTLGALAVVAAAVVRIYLGWAYVGNRLLSAAVEYEETGWYGFSPMHLLCRVTCGLFSKDMLAMLTFQV